ncbi:primase-helicase zinc-binding domain-containing protein [Aquabacter sp. CN5-332]|uniref:DUF7146 domain-containing protein n=1 Tax=Aquabacter sp. CN5-332 TaxID=3156608 RepID=UPI0032B3C67A
MTGSARDPEFEKWLDEARAVTCMEVIDKRGIKLAKGIERSGPCPVCGGTDRFSVHTRKDLWVCRAEGRGGRAIALVQYLDGADFIAACETLTSRPPPRGGTGVRLSPEELEAREAEAQKKRDAATVSSETYREEERQRLYRIFQNGKRAHEAPFLLAYFELRRLVLPPRCKVLRFLPDAPYFHGEEEDERGRKRPRLIYRGPAMGAAITDPTHIFRGLHFTWLDLTREKGKAEVFDPDTGEELPAKKSRGTKQGNRIELVPAPSGVATHGISGEGIETTLSVWADLMEAGWDLSATEFAAGVDLGNLAGAAEATVPHPTKRVVDKRGYSRPQRVKGPVPRMDSAAMWLPESIVHQTFLGDGDSDPFATRCAMERAEARHAAPGRFCTTAWAPEGFDFNDLRRRRHLPAHVGREAA